MSVSYGHEFRYTKPNCWTAYYNSYQKREREKSHIYCMLAVMVLDQTVSLKRGTHDGELLRGIFTVRGICGDETVLLHCFHLTTENIHQIQLFVIILDLNNYSLYGNKTSGNFSVKVYSNQGLGISVTFCGLAYLHTYSKNT